VGLRSDANATKWAKLGITEEVLCAVSGTKFHRASPAKGAPRIVVLTDTTLYFLDSSFAKKETVPLSCLRGLTFSPFNDGSIVFHFQDAPKGDVMANMLVSEMVALASRVALWATEKKNKLPAMVCSDTCELKVANKTLKLKFREDSTTKEVKVDAGREIVVRVPQSLF
jgi:hypothetical protein